MNTISLKFICKRGDKLLSESDNAELIIRELITILYDAQVKRCRCRIDEYYAGRNKYCKITGRYRELNGELTDYIVSGIRNEWGNFINVFETLYDNNIKIIQGGEKNNE